MLHRHLPLLLALLAPVAARAAQPAPGFPKKVGAVVTTPVATAGTEPDGSPRLVFGAGNELQCLTGNGRACDGYPVPLGEKVVVVGAPAAGDLDGDRSPEIAVTLSDGRLVVFAAGGSPLATFAFATKSRFEAGPALLDVNGDGRPEVVVGTRDGKLHALNRSGAELAGFPLSLGGAVTSTAASARLGAPAKVMIATGNEDGKLYVVDAAGKPMAGTPFPSQYMVSGEPAIGDIDGDGYADVAFASQDFKLYALHHDGRAFDGFPVDTGARLLTGPALADLDRDGRLEVVVSAGDGKVHVVDHRGTPVKGFPARVGERAIGAAVVADLDRDGADEVLAASADGQLHALRASGRPFSGYPAKLGGDPVGGPVVAELGDSTLVAIATADGIVAFKVRRSGKSSEPFAWPEAGHDAARSGRVHPNPPGYAELVLGPAKPTTESALKAKYRFFDLDGDPEPATEVRWFRDNKEVPELLGKLDVSADLTRKKESWRFQVSGPGATTRKSVEAVIANTPPGRPQIAFEPAIPRRAEALKVRVTQDAPDPDNDKISYRYAWLRDGQPQAELTRPELPPGTLKKGERWTVVVTASDGEADGPPATLDAVVKDSAPTAPQIALSPAEPKAGDAVKAVIKKEASDVDADALRYRYVFSIDGAPLASASTVDVLPPLSARKGQVISVEVRADDGELLGPPVTAQAKVVNTAPTAPQAAIGPKAPRTGEVLVAGLATPATDIDGDRLTYRFAFTRGGKKVTASADGREVAGVKKGETYDLEIVANDGAADSAPGRASTAVANTPPTTPAIAFEALPLRRVDPVKVKIVEPSTDADGDKVAYAWAWARDGKPQPELTGPELPAGTVRKGERWTVTLTPSDGQDAGTPARLEAVAVDSAPTAPEVALAPAEPKAGEAIKVVIRREASDVDGDRLQYRYQFLIDGTPVAGDGKADTLPALTAKKRQVVEVRVQAHDGEQPGPTALARATVVNTPPEPPKAQLQPEIPRRGDNLHAAIAAPAKDIDGDALTYRLTFLRDGKKQAASADGRELTGIKKGESYELEVVASDGEAESAAARAGAKVRNTPPTRPAVAFESLPLRRVDPVRVKMLAPATDADGDRIGYRYTWKRDGSVQESLTTAELPAGTLRKGERWSVTVTPNDGEEDGAAATLEAVVQDSAPTAPEIALSPAEPRAGDAVKAVIRREASDVDGDALKYRYRFLVDGAPLPLASSVDTLPALSARKKQVVTVEVQADDGETLGPVATARATVLNTPPATPKALLLPPEPRRGDLLQGGLAAAPDDVDGDRLAYRFAFTRDGKRVTATGEGREVPGIRKGETYLFEVVANDGEADSAPGSATVKVRNTVPTAPAVSFANEAPRSGEAVDLRTDRASTDPDGDSVSYEFLYTVNGSPAGLPKDARAIPANRIRKHEVWAVEVVPFDGEEKGPVGRARLQAINTVPTLPKVAIEPAEPTADIGAKARVVEASTDRDSDPVTYRYAWYVNGVRVDLAKDVAALAPGVLGRGDRVRLEVTPWDGEAEGPTATASAVVRNSAPSAPEIAIEPEKPTVRDELHCRVRTPSRDADRERPLLEYLWRRNGELQPVTAGQDRIAAGVARHGETWTCEVTATDGDLSSATVSARATVLNTPPTAPVPVVEPESPRAGQELVCRVAKASEDADADVVSYAFRWTQGGKPVAGDPKAPWIVPASAIRKGVGYRCEVTPSDGAQAGPVASAEARPGNTPPSGAAVRLAPESPHPAEALACEIARQASDPDGDKLRYRFTWLKNGVEQNLPETTNQIPAKVVRAGDIWRCIAAPFDGESEGDKAHSAEVIVQPPPTAER